MSEENEIEQHDTEVMNKAISLLMQHFDAVQVFVSRCEPGNLTLGFSEGEGNWYARKGQVEEWLNNGGIMNAAKEDE